MPLVHSSAVERVHYSAETSRLDIWYKGGSRYTYFDVPAEVYRALLEAASIGQFVNETVKDHYRFEEEPGRRRFRPG